MKRLMAGFILVVFGASGQSFSETMSFSEITSKLYDLRSLAQTPDSSEHSGSFSSRDRNAHYNPQSKKYEKWFSNDDGSGFIRKEKEGIVAAEMSGPGVIWRIWSAMPGEGLLKIYIDGKSEPTLSIPFKDYFDNTKEPFNYPELVGDNARGKNSYIPVVYQKSCKIVLCEGWGQYYQITYATFSADTKVPSFRGAFNAEEKACLGKANQIWADRHPCVSAENGTLTEKTVVIDPGQQIEIANYNSPASITAFLVQFPEISNSIASDPTKGIDVLRQLTLSMYWDGQEKPAVWAPLGDFFGTAPGINTYNSLPLGMSEKEFYSYWYMPFSSASILLKNESQASHKLIFKIRTEPLEKSLALNLLRFHAKWHRDNYSPQGRDRLMDDRWPDWMVLYTGKTKGRFCGMALHIWNPLPMQNNSSKNNYKWNFPDSHSFAQGTELNDFFKHDVTGKSYWWGEGDEKFFVDGETMPSTFGTGTEDYFGYAWATPAKFDSAVQCQTLNRENTGHISVCRWQIADNVPFQNSFEGCIEKYHDNNWPLLYAVTVYWYQQQGTADIYEPLSVQQCVNYYEKPEQADVAAKK
jgi:hypothetical protein